jgi:hypothetical protein
VNLVPYYHKGNAFQLLEKKQYGLKAAHPSSPSAEFTAAFSNCRPIGRQFFSSCSDNVKNRPCGKLP